MLQSDEQEEQEPLEETSKAPEIGASAGFVLRMEGRIRTGEQSSFACLTEASSERVVDMIKKEKEKKKKDIEKKGEM